MFEPQGLKMKRLETNSNASVGWGLVVHVCRGADSGNINVELLG